MKCKSHSSKRVSKVVWRYETLEKKASLSYMLPEHSLTPWPLLMGVVTSRSLLALEKKHRCEQQLLGQVSSFHLNNSFHPTQLQFKPWFGGRRESMQVVLVFWKFSMSQALMHSAAKHRFVLNYTSKGSGNILCLCSLYIECKKLEIIGMQ